ncbi:ABC transporter ATP-binding protein [Barrientosiimonas marina]|uniref:ABC transporter ATP-binding protein n=1 Tax=Lentibacillus kimchii TaxID=1542911 RepID=A0ABW2UWC7_9BACI
MVSVNADNIEIGYGEQPIIENLSVEIPQNQITTIIGPNGCGKSTLLKALTRIIPHQSGSVLVDGKDIAKEKTKALAQKMAILPQSPESANGLTVRELVSYGRYPYQKGLGRLKQYDRELIDWALDVTNISALRNESVDTLSGGQRQRVWIAMSLAQDTDMIFLDEPTTYLDMAHQLEVLELLQQLNLEQSRTIVMVLHDLNQAARFADHLIAMKDGDIVQTGTSEDVIQCDVLREVFSIDADICRDPRTNKPMCLTYNLLKGENQHEENTCPLSALNRAFA